MPTTAARPRDAEATRAALLACAHREFADRGFDGARIDEIAASAAINTTRPACGSGTSG